MESHDPAGTPLPQKTDAERWNARYRDPKWARDLELDPFVLEAIEELGPGAGRRALDLAGGTGRHALELAARGWQVEIWDVSEVGFEILARKAGERGLEVTRRLVDLTAPLPQAPAFDLVLVVNYLDRRIYDELQRLLAPGGHAVVATFTKDCEMGLTPSRCLDRGELAEGLPGLRSLRHTEADGRSGLFATLEIPKQARTL